ncbi:hypothetical protein Btru_057763 [Bulinus truncatus]|nr:hypothetical protein Btru_057763 [Bulinus truncatus]
MDYSTPVFERSESYLPDVISPSSEHQGKQKDQHTPRRKSILRTPSFLPVSSTGLSKKLTNKHCDSDKETKTSPGLARLRLTPGFLREKQKNLIFKHKEILQKGSHLQAGGGISLWPEMHLMRLTRKEFLLILVEAVILCGLTLVLLSELHGQTFSHLKKFTKDVKQFCITNFINESDSQEKFHSQVTQWHNDFYHLTENIQAHFDLTSMSPNYQIYILTYILGLLVLLYYLLDNMLAKNKLTPSRVKKWTCLLMVIGSWTCTMAYGLFLASQLEREMVRCVQQFSSFLVKLVVCPLNLEVFQAVLLYWRTQFLDSTSIGILHLFGIIPIRDLLYYLQYYSVPIATVLLSPVLQLCCACLAIYGKGEYVKIN